MSPRKERPTGNIQTCVWALDSQLQWRGCTRDTGPWYSPEEWQYCPHCGKLIEVRR